MKQYANDWAKENSRQELLYMIKKHILNDRRPHETKVVHLPGPNGQEYKSVYAPLGIPPQNVTGIEENPTSAHSAQKENPNTKVLCTSLIEYVNREKNLSQDVISIDLTTNINGNTSKLLDAITQKLSTTKILLHVAVSARREGEKNKRLLRQYEHAYARAHEAMNGQPHQRTPELEGQRDIYLSMITLNALSGLHIDKKYELFERVLGGSRQELISAFRDDLSKEQSSALSDRSIMSLCAPTVLEQSLANLQARLFNTYGYTTTNKDVSMQNWRSGARAIHFALSTKELGHYRTAQDTRRYAYISESGTPMIGDIVYIRAIPSIFNTCIEIAHALGHEQGKIKDKQAMLHGLREYKRLYFKHKINEEAGHLERDRIFLGSSARPMLRKAIAISLLSEGRTPAELAQEYRGMNIRQLSALKAHVTMGTYLAIDPDTTSTNDLNDDITARAELAVQGTLLYEQTLTRDDALQYLRANITPEEINTAYNGNTVSQLHAWNHWLKQGKYQ